MNFTKRKKVGIWVRVSTDQQNKSDSPEIHEARAKSYAEMKGWQVVKKYNVCFSGKSVLHHSETQQMLQDIRTGHIQALIFSKLARLARNVKELIEIAEHFKKHNADLISLAESIDTSTPAGRLLFHVIASLAQWEREEISARIIASIVTRAKQGLPLGGVAPYGYKWENKKLMVEGKEASLAREIYNTFLKCRKIITTAKIMNDYGHRTRKGVKWSDTSVRRLLTDTTYKGIHYLNHTGANGKGWKSKRKEDWFLLKVKAIVKKEIWEQVNSILYINGSRRVRRKNVYLLTGLIYCSDCGCKMYGYAYGRSKGYYRCQKCTNKILIKEIEDILIRNLKKFVFRPKDLIGLPKDTTDIQTRKLRRLKKVKQETDAKIEETFELYHKKHINNGIFAERITKLEAIRENISKTIPEIEEEVLTKKLKDYKNDISNHLRSIGKIFNTLNFQERRSLVEDIVDSIKINNNNIYINFYLLNFFQKNMDLLRKFNERTWIHCRCEHEARRICQRDLCPADRYRTIFKRLS